MDQGIIMSHRYIFNDCKAFFLVEMKSNIEIHNWHQTGFFFQHIWPACICFTFLLYIFLHMYVYMCLIYIFLNYFHYICFFYLFYLALVCGCGLLHVLLSIRFEVCVIPPVQILSLSLSECWWPEERGLACVPDLWLQIPEEFYLCVNPDPWPAPRSLFGVVDLNDTHSLPNRPITAGRLYLAPPPKARL